LNFHCRNMWSWRRWNNSDKGGINRINFKNISRTRHETTSFQITYIKNTWINLWMITPIKVSSTWYGVLLLSWMSTITWQ
jgi:hypothetical protein